ncbi:hypothetical protein B0H10DRAFT_2240817 [Mycena sp. CBHHK59/15]|nr:hypothetical protein B0H10DRAFT_2240817 [Mycena sp. CBHHK59/15]
MTMAPKKGQAPPPTPAPAPAADADAPLPLDLYCLFLSYTCTVCTCPPEYCDLGASLTKCKDWLKGEHLDLFDKYYSDKVLQAKLEKDMAKKEIKAEVKADTALKKKMVSQAFSIDLKKASKQFSSKFAMGSFVTKNPQGLEEIIVSRDVSGEILEMIDNDAGVLKGIPADNVELVEKKKKGGD